MLQLFGIACVTGMLVTYALEHRSHWYVLGFYVFCLLGGIYCFMHGAWPFAAAELVWAFLALMRWMKAYP